MKKIIVGIIALTALVAGLWFIAIPESMIIDIIEGSPDKGKLYLKTEDFKKGLFYNFSAGSISVREKGLDGDSEKPLFIFDDFKGRLDFGSLFRLSPKVSFESRMGNGIVSGRVGLKGRDDLIIKGDNIDIKEIPLLESLGISGEGVLSGNYLSENGKGDLKFSVSGAVLKNTYLGNMFLPLALFNDIKAAVSMSDGTAEVKSLAMSGRGGYGRIKGGMKGNHMDMSLELMADASYQAAVPLAIVEQYKVSPGYYVIPLKGELPQLR